MTTILDEWRAAAALSNDVERNRALASWAVKHGRELAEQADPSAFCEIDLDAAEAECASAREALRAAEAHYHAAVDAAEVARGMRQFDDVRPETLTPAQLVEHVADLARCHGASCARRGGTTMWPPYWVAFRKALAHVRERLEVKP